MRLKKNHNRKLLTANKNMWTLGFFIMFSCIGTAVVVSANVSARTLTGEENEFYAQNNIIFTVPCNAKSDCNLTFGGFSGDENDGSTAEEGGSGSGGVQSIVEEAKRMSWPDADGKCRDAVTGAYVDWKPNEPTGCLSTVNDYARGKGYIDGYNTSGTTLQDCGVFVGYVLRHTVDPNALDHGTYSQADTLDSHSSLWKRVSRYGVEYPMASLEPGDVLIAWTGRTHGSGGHIVIWIGNQRITSGDGKTYTVNIASASWKGRTPSLRRMTTTTYTSGGVTVPYHVYRYIGG